MPLSLGVLRQGELVAFDASKNQAKGLISTIEEYRDELDTFAFTFKRTGEKTKHCILFKLEA